MNHAPTVNSPTFQRSMKVIGTMLITLSAITPASSVFIIVPGIIGLSGTGALMSMVIAAIVCGLMAVIYAELASAYPISGGEYAIVARVVSPALGFTVLGVVLVSMVLIPAVMALGISTYLAVIVPELPVIPTAIITIVIATALSILNIRTNAIITGIFLGIEILALIVLAFLGFGNIHQSLPDLLFHPVMLNGDALAAAPFSAIAMATTVGIFAYNGYGTAVYLGEETHDARQHIGRAIIWALLITVACEFLPLLAVLMGASDLKALLASENIFGDFITNQAGAQVGAAISLGIALAIFNAIIAMIVQGSRVIYSTGRDKVWSPMIDTAFTKISPRYKSPWIATIFTGLIAIFACFIDINVLFVITGTGLIFVLATLCITTLVGRKMAWPPRHITACRSTLCRRSPL